MASSREFSGKYQAYNEPYELGLNRVKGFEVHDGGCGRLVAPGIAEEVRKVLSAADIKLKEEIVVESAGGKRTVFGHRGELFIDVYNESNIECGLTDHRKILDRMVGMGFINKESFLYYRIVNGYDDAWIPATSSKTGDFPEDLDELRFRHYMSKADSGLAITVAMCDWLQSYAAERKGRWEYYLDGSELEFRGEFLQKLEMRSKEKSYVDTLNEQRRAPSGAGAAR